MLIAMKGLIGSGKTTSAEYLHKKYNAYHYNCDKRVKAIYASHKEVIAEVNSKILNTVSDSIDLKQLAKIAFGDKQKLLELEAIIYPYLEAEIEALSENYEFVLIDGQQIDKLELDISWSISIIIDEDILIQRVVARDGRSIEQIKEILDIQRSYQMNSDFIVYNNSKLMDLKISLDKVMEEIYEKTSR